MNELNIMNEKKQVSCNLRPNIKGPALFLSVLIFKSVKEFLSAGVYIPMPFFVNFAQLNRTLCGIFFDVW